MRKSWAPSRARSSRSRPAGRVGRLRPAWSRPTGRTSSPVVTPSASDSAKPVIAVSGVRSSCDTDSRKSRCRPSLVLQSSGQRVERVGDFGYLGRPLRRPAARRGRRRPDRAPPRRRAAAAGPTAGRAALPPPRQQRGRPAGPASCAREPVRPGQWFRIGAGPGRSRHRWPACGTPRARFPRRCGPAKGTVGRCGVIQGRCLSGQRVATDHVTGAVYPHDLDALPAQLLVDAGRHGARTRSAGPLLVPAMASACLARARCASSSAAPRTKPYDTSPAISTATAATAVVTSAIREASVGRVTAPRPNSRPHVLS